MKKLFIVTLCVFTFFVSCKKSDNDSNGNNIPTDGFRINGNNYSYTSCVRYTPTTLKVYGSSSNLVVMFNAMPTVSATYGIVGYKTTLPATGQLSFANIGGSNECASKTTTSVVATITVTNGIINVVIPDVDVETPTGTVKFSANITEK